MLAIGVAGAVPMLVKAADSLGDRATELQKIGNVGASLAAEGEHFRRVVLGGGRELPKLLHAHPQGRAGAALAPKLPEITEIGAGAAGPIG